MNLKVVLLEYNYLQFLYKINLLFITKSIIIIYKFKNHFK